MTTPSNSYTDLTAEFDYKDLLTWQNLDKLGENDAHLRQLFASYRRPVLKYINATNVDVESNGDVTHETEILFSDGEIRSVTEDTSSSNKYRRFNITADAEFTSGTEESGLRAALSEATNTSYAVYAVKSLINTANFVLVGDTTLPLVANFATLNAAYGTNGWVYLGMILNGNNSDATGDILEFAQSGNQTLLYNICDSANAGIDPAGKRLNSTAGATSLTYTYAAGTGQLEIPNHCSKHNLITCVWAASSSRLRARTSAGTRTFWTGAGGSLIACQSFWIYPQEDIKIDDVAGNSLALDIHLAGWVDDVLGVGSNPLL